MSTTVNLGMLPQNRGEFTTATWPQNISIYKDNIVQYNGSSYIYNPASFDIEHPEASATSLRPYNSTPASLNTGWAVFASGNNTFTTGQSVDELSIDAKLSHTSNGIPSSSEVFNKFIESGVFDLSAYNAVGGELATYVDLGAALTAMNSLQAAYKKGGMSVKFVLSSDNNYVQYRYMLPYGGNTPAENNKFVTPTNWQGVDDEPTAGSNSLVKSGGVRLFQSDVLAAYGKDSLTENGYYKIDCYGIEDLTTNSNCVNHIFNIPEDSKSLIIRGSYDGGSMFTNTIVFFDADGNNVDAFYLTKTFENIQLKDSYKKVSVSTLKRNDLVPFVNILFSGLYFASDSDVHALYDEISDMQNDVASLEEDIISIKGEPDTVYTGFTDGFFEANPSRANFGNITKFGNYKHIKLDVIAGQHYLINAVPTSPNIGWGTKDANNTVIRYGADNISELTIQDNEVELYISNTTAFNPSPSVTLKGKTGEIQEIQEEIEAIQEEMADNENYLTISESQQERAIRKALWQQQRIAPFTWKPFVKSYFSWMNDDALASAPSYYAVCRNKRTPYCHAFIVRNPEPTFTYNGVDSERLNFIKEPVAGETYTIEIESGEYSTLCLYQDRRGNALDGGLSVTVNGSTSNVSLVSNRVSLGTVSSVSFKINASGSLSAGTRLKYLNIILTNSASDTESESEWSAEEFLKNIVFDFGEILAHGSTVINTFDISEGEKLLAYYTYEVPRIINEMIGENHVHGLITIGGPNSTRWFNTEIGQEYMVRNMLYGDYYGITPQYTITRNTLTTLARLIQFIVPHGTLSVNTTYTLGTTGVVVKGIDVVDASNDIVYATYSGSLPASSGNVYKYNTSTMVTTYSSLQQAEDNATVRAIMYNNIDAKITSLVTTNGFYPFFNHEEVPPFAVDVFLQVLIDKGLYIGTWYDAYFENS